MIQAGRRLMAKESVYEDMITKTLSKVGKDEAKKIFKSVLADRKAQACVLLCSMCVCDTWEFAVLLLCYWVLALRVSCRVLVLRCSILRFGRRLTLPCACIA